MILCSRFIARYVLVILNISNSMYNRTYFKVFNIELVQCANINHGNNIVNTIVRNAIHYISLINYIMIILHIRIYI